MSGRRFTKDICSTGRAVVGEGAGTAEDLAAADPAVEKAMAALNTLDPKELGAADLARFPRKTSLRSFVTDQIGQIDMAQSQLGFCGR